MTKILLTGGLGFIGSHVAVELLNRSYEVVILDDLSNSDITVLNRINELTGQKVSLELCDIRNKSFLESIFDKYQIDSVIHFAAKKAVGESFAEPLLYYDVNVGGMINLLQVIKEKPVRKLIFSSSCTVYGNPVTLPVTEQNPFGETPSPYGKTKQVCENILISESEVVDYEMVSLRYFNPVGAHQSAMIGELPKGKPNNLVPFITQTAAGLRDQLHIFGGDYNTPDGTAIRDYIHVVDLALAHVNSLEVSLGKYMALNIGTGKGHSVLEVVKTFEEVSGMSLNYKIVGKRSGDLPMIYGATDFANKQLRWQAERGLKEMLADAWRWQQHILTSRN